MNSAIPTQQTRKAKILVVDDDDLVALARQDLGGGPKHDLVVVDDQDLGLASSLRRNGAAHEFPSPR